MTMYERDRREEALQERRMYIWQSRRLDLIYLQHVMTLPSAVAPPWLYFIGITATASKHIQTMQVSQRRPTALST
jgi:hypothetical protein